MCIITFTSDVVLKLESPVASGSLLWGHFFLLSSLLLCANLLQIDGPLVECGCKLPGLLVVIHTAQHLG